VRGNAAVNVLSVDPAGDAVTVTVGAKARGK
jgi:hypothetical protein